MKTPFASSRPFARQNRIRGRAGFTLVEALVALLVFSLGVLALGLVIPMATGRINRAGSQTRASALAAERAETLLITPYGHGDLAQGAHADPANPVDGLYYVKWTVTDDQPITSCKRIVVSVARWGLNRTPEAALTIVTPQSGG